MSEPIGNVVDIQAKAAELNLEVKYPTSDELFVDIDTNEDFIFLNSNIDKLKKHFKSVTFTWSISKSGGDKKHIIVKMPWPMSEIERICLQACLGSDRVRELLSFISLNHDPLCKPTCFFEKKINESMKEGTNKNIYGGY